MSIVLRTIVYLFSFALILLIVYSWSMGFPAVVSGLMTIAYVIQVVSLIVFASEDINDYNCFRRFEYQGKTYRFK